MKGKKKGIGPKSTWFEAAPSGTHGAQSSVRCSVQMVGHQATNGSFCDAGL